VVHVVGTGPVVVAVVEVLAVLVEVLVVVVEVEPPAMTQVVEIVLALIVTVPVFAKAAPWSDAPVPSVTLE
jgi:hypothetical protein